MGVEGGRAVSYRHIISYLVVGLGPDGPELLPRDVLDALELEL